MAQPQQTVLMALSVLSVLVLFSPGTAAHTAGCGSHAVSSPATLWTHAEPVAGALRPSVAVSFIEPNWVAIPPGDGPTPEFIWKTDTSAATATATPVVFTQTLTGCGGLPYLGSLRINADNYYVASFNGVPVASCGLPAPVYADPVMAPLLKCFTNYQQVNVQVLPTTNVLTVEVWNAGNLSPLQTANRAMLQYTLEY